MVTSSSSQLLISISGMNDNDNDSRYIIVITIIIIMNDSILINDTFVSISNTICKTYQQDTRFIITAANC